MGICSDKLNLFYVANIRSILTYGIAAFYSLLSKRQLELLECKQRLCTRIILPDIYSYTKRLQILGLPTVKNFSFKLFKDHFMKIYGTDHVLSSLMPDRQSKNKRHSSRLSDSFLTRCTTSLRSKSFFFYGAKTLF